MADVLPITSGEDLEKISEVVTVNSSNKFFHSIVRDMYTCNAKKCMLNV